MTLYLLEHLPGEVLDDAVHLLQRLVDGHRAHLLCESRRVYVHVCVREREVNRAYLGGDGPPSNNRTYTTHTYPRTQHSTHGDGGVAEDPLARFVDVLPRAQVHQCVRAPQRRPLQFLHLFKGWLVCLYTYMCVCVYSEMGVTGGMVRRRPSRVDVYVCVLYY